MKKLTFAFTIIIAACFILSSCKKESTKSSSDNYIKGEKDGVAFNFTANAIAKISDFGGVTVLNLAAGGSGLEGFNIGINFMNSSDIKTGSYTEEYIGSDYLIAGVYNPNSTTIVYGAGIVSPSALPLVVNILTKTSTEITGTFEGAFYKEDVSAGTIDDDDYITITKGEFKLPLK